MYNTIMKLEDLPDYAKPYKKKGYDVRKQGKAYFLYKISSKRVPGKKYPVLEQEYIGVIDERGSLINKKEYPSKKRIEYIEWGLSSFIYKIHKGALQRAIFNGVNSELVMLAVIQYVFGSISEVAINSCYIARDKKEELKKLASVVSDERLKRLVKKIAEEQRILFGEDLIDAEILMRLCVMDKESSTEPKYSSEVLALLERHGVKL